MINTRKLFALLGVAMLLLALAGSTAWAKDAPDEETPKERSFIEAGSYVGYVIIALSFVGVALAVYGFLNINEGKLLPPIIMSESLAKAKAGKFTDIATFCQGNDSMLGRILTHGLAQAGMGLPAVREALQEQGVKEVTKLQHRVGYIGFIGTVAPMLGLLGTVIGMIRSFNVLGAAGGTAQPDKLAVGISEALVTTCMGLIVALPLMFLHSFLRNRVTQIGQEAGGFCERFVRTMATKLGATKGVPAKPAHTNNTTSQ